MDRRYCAYPPCDVDITDRAENCRYCEDRHRTAHWKLKKAEAEPTAKRTRRNGQNARQRSQRSLASGLQVSFNRAVEACEKALLEGLLYGQPSESTIPWLTRRFMTEALPAKQRERLEAGQ